MTNGGTEAFIDVLMPAVADLADAMWDFRFAALLSLQDQQVMGRGAVGFDLHDIAWGARPRGSEPGRRTSCCAPRPSH
ncbi:hypothetical protein [Streptomyces rimosus]|uniref:hypothetical protein n=1 Tax=Streptomyces rimosus TaxID=1927 RepID=UPI001F23E7D8|nr:hypothetical protein [Streptomyces rimosus]